MDRPKIISCKSIGITGKFGQGWAVIVDILIKDKEWVARSITSEEDYYQIYNVPMFARELDINKESSNENGLNQSGLNQSSLNGRVKNMFMLTPYKAKGERNFYISTLNTHFLPQIIAFIMDRFRHQFWSSTPMPSYEYSWTEVGQLFYYDNRPKVFTIFRDKRFLKYKLVPYNVCQIAIVPPHFKRRRTNESFVPIKHIIISDDEEQENFVAIICHNLEKAFEYIDTPGEQRGSYMTFGFSGLSRYSLHKRLRGLILMNDGDYVRVELNRKNYKPCHIKNNLIINSVKKHILKDVIPQWMSEHITFEGLEAKYRLAASSSTIPTTPTINNIGNDDFENIYILKPSVGNMAFGGHGIFVTTNLEEYLEIKPLIIKRAEEKYVAQRYIVNPMTFDGKKCHLRLYIMTTSWGECYFCPLLKIMTAKLPYINGDWLNKEIHDSHLGSTDDNYNYPKDKDRCSPQLPIYDLIAPIYEDIKKLFDPKLYEGEAKYGYRILGADIMFSEGKIWILEINMTPAMASVEGKSYEIFEEVYLKWEYLCIKDKMKVIEPSYISVSST